MAANYIHTPAATDASYLNTGLDRLGELSPEKSFLPPQKNGDLISQMRGARRNGTSLKTPRAAMREPLKVLPNANQPKSEFTPLMKSITKTSMARRLSGRRSVGNQTPAYLKENQVVNGATPALPRMLENSQIQSEHTTSSAGGANNFTPIPQHASSSAQSTPLAQLPTREAGGVVNNGNVMTLREQENVIEKIDKENFGLKMKIHFLEEALLKGGSEFNQAALKENTDLKVNRITMQRELHKFKKNIAQAERDAEIYRLQLEQYRQSVKQKHANESTRLEMERLQSELLSKEAEIERLQNKLESVKDSQDQEAEKLRDDVEDLQADMKEKERKLEDFEDEIDALKMNASKDSSKSDELQDEIESLNEQLEQLKQDLERAEDRGKEAKDEREEALDEKKRAEDDLEELRDEIANKSFTTKGLSRQLEEKSNKLEDDLNELQEKHENLQEQFDEKLQNERKLQERVRELEKEGASEDRQMHRELEMAQQQRDTAERKLISMTKQVETLQEDLEIKTEEKDLLQSRHDALTTESAQLQRDLSKAQKTISDVENALDEERQRAAHNELLLRNQQKQEADLLNSQIDSLHREVNAKDSALAAQEEEWGAQKLKLAAASQRAEERATGLQRTVDKLHEAQGTLSGSEMKLQEALGSEKQRHQEEERRLLGQIEDLNANLAAKRSASDESRVELSNAKEELRISIREQAALNEKVAELEEEIEVLQADIEEEHNFAEELQKKSLEASDSQVGRIQKEKQSLQDQLASVNIELHSAKRAAKTAEAERESLEKKLQKVEYAADDTFNAGDSEKRELRRAKQKLERDLERTKSERDNLQQINQNLEEEVNAEVSRANIEEQRLNDLIDNLRSKQPSAGDTRELTSAKAKVARLEARIVELDNQTKIIQSPIADISGLKADLMAARDSEAAAIKREADLKSSNRKLNAQLHDLEKELHELRLAQFKASSRSPSTSPGQASKDAEELARVRRELFDVQSEIRDVQKQNRELRRSSASNKKSVEVDETERADLHKLVKERVLEAESLRGELQDKDGRIEELKTHVRRLRDERKAQHHHHPHAAPPDISLKALRDVEAKEMKGQLQRLREERSIANKKAEAVEHELEILQGRYESMLEKLAEVAGRREGAEKLREKEMKGLLREMGWLKGALKREKRMREDAVWAKGWVERREDMRVRW